jgi:hypothetical protein
MKGVSPMNDYDPGVFEEILDNLGHEIDKFVDCGAIRSIESNFNTKGMSFSSKNNPDKVGTIFVGENDGAIAVDIDVQDGAIRSLTLSDKNDIKGLENITGWFKDNYK